MVSNPQVLELLEEMLDSGKTPEEVCRDCPDLLSEVRERWQEFQLIDAQLKTFLPGLAARHDCGATSPVAAALPQVPGYEVEAVLGRGGMGVVYKARHLALKRTVALKMLAAGHSHSAERARFRAEAEAVARLQHSNIVQIHEVGEADGRPFFALEYVAGGSLAERLAGRPLRPSDAARLVAMLAEAMHLAHSRNLVHRDLKPGNVLLAGECNAPVGQCQPKVTDFGLVRQLDADSGQTLDGTVMGTPSYMAPEQAAGRTQAVGPAADVYALGAILYECLTGRPPFEGATPLETLLQVRGHEPAAPSSLNRHTPRDLETICLKCLSKEPERRYASAQELADDLGRFGRGEPVAARPVGRAERVGKWVRRNPTVATLSAVAALALVAGTVVSVVFGVEAHRKANALEQQSLQLQEQTRTAQKNARRAEDKEQEMERVLVSGLLIPIARNPHQLTFPLDPAETDAVRQLRATRAALRLQFMETALRDPETARRVGRRADWVVQAAVGCDRDLRADVARLVVRRIQEPDAPHEVKFACARIGLAINLADPAWAEQAADALIAELGDPQLEREDYPLLAEGLAAVCERLPPTQGADRAAKALGLFLTRLEKPQTVGLAGKPVCEAIVALARVLDATTAASVAEKLGRLIPECKGQLYQYHWPPLSQALVAVCRRLPAADAAAHINKAVDLIVLAVRDTTKKKDNKISYMRQVDALAALCGRLDVDRAGRVTDAIIGILGDSQMLGDRKELMITHVTYVRLLTQVVEHLDTPGSLRAAEGLVLVLRNVEGDSLPLEDVRTALVALCKRLDATGAARAAAAVLEAVRNPKPVVLVHVVFADALAALADRLTPEQAADLESALVEALRADLANAKARVLLHTGYAALALAKVCGRSGAAGGADALVAALRDPQMPFPTFKPLAGALAETCGRLPPEEAATRVKGALEILDSLWDAKQSPVERAALAEAMATLWTRLDAAEAAARAKRAAACLEDAIQDSKTHNHEIASVATALSAVYNFLDPAERSERANAAANHLAAALRKPKTHFVTATLLSNALAALCAHQDRPGLARTTETLLAVLENPSIPPLLTGPMPSTHQNVFVLYETLFNSVAARLDERDLQRFLDQPLAAGHFQRAVLNVLARSKGRSFRNTWDYLDATGI